MARNQGIFACPLRIHPDQVQSLAEKWKQTYLFEKQTQGDFLQNKSPWYGDLLQDVIIAWYNQISRVYVCRRNILVKIHPDHGCSRKDIPRARSYIEWPSRWTGTNNQCMLHANEVCLEWKIHWLQTNNGQLRVKDWRNWRNKGLPKSGHIFTKYSLRSDAKLQENDRKLADLLRLTRAHSIL